MGFYGVYWSTDDLSTKQIAKWEAHSEGVVGNHVGILPKSFHGLPIDVHVARNPPGRLTAMARETRSAARLASIRSNLQP